MHTQERAEERTPVPGNLRGVKLASPNQVSYLEGLRDGKDLSSLTEEQRNWLENADAERFAKLSGGRGGKASQLIEQLKELPWKPRETDQPRFAEMMNLGVQTGRYAIPGEDGALRFYSVKRDEKRTACWVSVWASDAQYPIKAIPTRIEILKAIAADPDAGPRFGREIGRCYVCGRTLTDETSRALGIGPVCRGDQ